MMSWIRAHRPSASDESGMTLVEVLIAVFVLAIAVLALASAASASLAAVRQARNRQNAVEFASSTLEAVRATEFEFVAHDTSDPNNPPATFDPGDGTPRTVYETDEGQVDHVTTLTVDGKTFTATTYVVEDPNANRRRVTTIVTWTDRGRTFEIREETFVAHANRGLPAPRFTLSPDTNNASGELLGNATCVNHTLSNTGETDSYSWRLYGRDSSGNLVAGVFETMTSVTTANDSQTWTNVQGFRLPGTATASNWFGFAQIRRTTSDPWQTFVDGGGSLNTPVDQRPDSPFQVPRLTDALVRFCFTPRNNAGTLVATQTAPLFVPHVYSQFDETVNDSVVDTLSISATLRRLYLHHLANPTTPRQFPMDTSPPAFSDDSVDYDSDGVPGLSLGTAASWSYQFGGNTNVNQSVPGNAWVRAGSVAPDDPDNPQAPSMTITMTVQHVKNQNVTTLNTQTRTISPTTTDWQQLTPTFTLPSSPFQFKNNEYIRLLVSCAPGTRITGCHVHYDTTNLASFLDLTIVQ